jgi:hypothetical protein
LIKTGDGVDFSIQVKNGSYSARVKNACVFGKQAIVVKSSNRKVLAKGRVVDRWDTD